MTTTNEKGWPEPPIAGDEIATLLGALDRQRSYLGWKCGGLDAAAMRTRLEPSAITLGGLLKHMALVEELYFSHFLFGREYLPPWDSVDWDATPDWEWDTAGDHTPEELMDMWKNAVERSRLSIDEALADGGLDRLTDHKWPDGRSMSLRRVLIDMIEEYARHVGHADLIRESIDGLVGEDPA